MNRLYDAPSFLQFMVCHFIFIFTFPFPYLSISISSFLPFFPTTCFRCHLFFSYNTLICSSPLVFSSLLFSTVQINRLLIKDRGATQIIDKDLYNNIQRTDIVALFLATTASCKCSHASNLMSPLLFFISTTVVIIHIPIIQVIGVVIIDTAFSIEMLRESKVDFALLHRFFFKSLLFSSFHIISYPYRSSILSSIQLWCAEEDLWVRVTSWV